MIGLLVQNNRVNNNSSNGISVTNGLNVEIAFNMVRSNGANGISYSGGSSLIHDNVVDHNGQFGIYVKDGVNHRVYDNAADSNGTSRSTTSRSWERRFRPRRGSTTWIATAETTVKP